MQAEATDSLLAEGVESLGVKDSDKPTASKDEEGNSEQLNTELINAAEGDTALKDDKGESGAGHRIIHILD